MALAVRFPDTLSTITSFLAGVFRNRPQQAHFSEYLLGLVASQNKTVTGIRDFYAFSKDASSLNRFFTEAVWNEQELNRQRLVWTQSQKELRYDPRGVIAIDNVLIDHVGKLICDVGFFWDHAEQRHKIAHDYLIGNYVTPEGKHFPLEFFRFRKREVCEAAGCTFEDHNVLFRKLITWTCEEKIPGAFAFDSYFTHAENLNHIHGYRNEHDGEPRSYVGDLKFNRKLWVAGKEVKASEWAKSIANEQKKILEEKNGKKQWYFTTCVRIPNVNHKVRVIVLWKEKGDTEPRKILISNRTTWDVRRIVGVYRYRWTGTETFHRDGKQLLGMGDCQLRDGQGQTRHMYLVFVAYSYLMSKAKIGYPKNEVISQPVTVGEVCRSIAQEVFRDTLTWAIRQVTQGRKSLEQTLRILRFA